MDRVAFDELLADVTSACEKGPLSGFALEEVYQKAQELSAHRTKSLEGCALAEGVSGVPYDLLLLFDVVVVAASLEAKRVGALQGDSDVSVEVVDLWIQAVAARALWYERYVLWPKENPVKKFEYLLETARQLGTESVARALLDHSQPIKFTEFVARLGQASETSPSKTTEMAPT